MKEKAFDAYGFGTDEAGQAMDKASDIAGKAKDSANEAYIHTSNKMNQAKQRTWLLAVQLMQKTQ